MHSKPLDRPGVAVRAATLLGAMLLASCGGGGDATPAAATAAVPTGLAPAAPSTCGLADFAATALARMNQLRAAGADCRTRGQFAPAAALTWNALLTLAAERHSQDMVAGNFFSHVSSDGSTLADRVNATGYDWSDLGENIAAGYSGIDKVMAGWMASDGHCANLMDPAFKEVGLVCVAGSTATAYDNYWTMDLGRSR